MSLSIRTKIVATSLLVLGSGAVVAGSYSISAHPALIAQSTAAVSALTSGNFEGFKSALKKESDQKIDAMTQEQFAQLQNRYEVGQKVQAAIDANDYNAFVSIAPDKMKERINSPEEFAKLAERNVKRKQFESRLNEAAKNKDKKVFVSVLEEWEAYRESNKPVGSSSHFENRMQPTAEQKQAHIDALYDQAVKDVESGKTFALEIKDVFGIGRGRYGTRGFEMQK